MDRHKHTHKTLVDSKTEIDKRTKKVETDKYIYL